MFIEHLLCDKYYLGDGDRAVHEAEKVPDLGKLKFEWGDELTNTQYLVEINALEKTNKQTNMWVKERESVRGLS